MRTAIWLIAYALGRYVDLYKGLDDIQQPALFLAFAFSFFISVFYDISEFDQKFNS